MTFGAQLEENAPMEAMELTSSRMAAGSDTGTAMVPGCPKIGPRDDQPAYVRVMCGVITDPMGGTPKGGMWT